MNFSVRGADRNDLFVLQNRPNPFRGSTIIPIVSGSNDRVQFDVYGNNGLLVISRVIEIAEGMNEILVTSDQIPGSGVYYYRITTSGDTYTRKMTFIK